MWYGCPFGWAMNAPLWARVRSWPLEPVTIVRGSGTLAELTSNWDIDVGDEPDWPEYKVRRSGLISRNEPQGPGRLGPADAPVVASRCNTPPPASTNSRLSSPNSRSVGWAGIWSDGSAVSVAVFSTPTKFDPELATYSRLPSGLRAIPLGLDPMNTVRRTLRSVVSMMATAFRAGTDA